MTAALEEIVETCACPLCGADSPRRTPYGEKAFRVVGCGDCGGWYLSPRLPETQMKRYYAGDGYFSGGEAGYEDYRQQESSLRMTFRAILERMRASGWTGGDLLEVGCGYGFFLDEARPHFDRVTGLDMSEAAARQARRCGAEVFVGGLASLPAERTYDCLMAHHVIEHVYRPDAFLADLVAHAKPGARVVLATPDMASFWRRMLGRRWPSFKYPEHVVFFDTESLSRLMARAGLRDLRRISYVDYFPLREVLNKVGLGARMSRASISIPFPRVSVAIAGRWPGKGPS